MEYMLTTAPYILTELRKTGTMVFKPENAFEEIKWGRLKKS